MGKEERKELEKLKVTITNNADAEQPDLSGESEKLTRAFGIKRPTELFI